MNYITAYIIVLAVFFGSCEYLDKYKETHGRPISTSMGIFVYFVPVIVVGFVLREMLSI